MSYLLLLIGFFLLIKGADIFVDGASSISRKIGIPSIIVGLTIVSIGTSAPELAVSILSSLKGSNDMAVGNVLGSNIFNILVVLGATALIMPINIYKKDIKRDYLITLSSSVILMVMAFLLSFNGGNLEISRVEGLILLLSCIAYMVLLVKVSLKNRESSVESSENTKDIKIFSNILKIVVGIIGIVVGGNGVVDSASNIAIGLGMSDKLVGLTIVAVGTSLPELVTSMVAAKKGENEIALGNVLGSCIFNVLLIIGVSSAITPIAVAMPLLIDFIVMMASVIILGLIIFCNKKEIITMRKYQGVIFILLYVGYLAFIIFRN